MHFAIGVPLPFKSANTSHHVFLCYGGFFSFFFFKIFEEYFIRLPLARAPKPFLIRAYNKRRDPMSLLVTSTSDSGVNV